MRDIDARKFQCASKTVTLKMRETHGPVFLVIALCNPVLADMIWFSFEFIL